jgi:hypothetical protein
MCTARHVHEQKEQITKGEPRTISHSPHLWLEQNVTFHFEQPAVVFICDLDGIINN